MGNACPDLEWVKQDIAKARACLCEGQVLMVSVFGDGNTLDQIAQDFAVTARLAYESGAHVIELNLSCPNINQHFFYKDGKYVAQILQKVRQTLPHIPVIVKVGLFESTSQMREIFTIAATSGAQGVCGINSIPVQVCTKNGQPFFGDKRRVNGLSGSPIRSLAQQFVKDARACIAEGKLNLVLLAAGGATEATHFKEFFKLRSNSSIMRNRFYAQSLYSSKLLPGLTFKRLLLGEYFEVLSLRSHFCRGETHIYHNSLPNFLNIMVVQEQLCNG
ncbi:MAG: hypothetical protein M1114_01595 [Candidatus Dependentiae bacterium]|nr:hypothetical protein [Candidatus Dependentiae bacterium]